jgi:EAL domain-containing protein (putative c-di-GMP-specific phosphodiesterase class I)
VSVAINLSAIEFQPDLYANIVTALAESGLSASQLEIEVTESALMADGAAAIEILHQIRDLGARTALDDFGTGYASLSYLRMFPFNKIKIDRSFVSDLESNRDGALEIIRCISQLGANLGMHTTAEGVETMSQLELVRAEGCTEIQGYLLSKPRPAHDLARLLSEPPPFALRTRSSAA